MRVFLDTTALHENHRLRGAALHVLLLGSQLGIHDLFIAQVVIEEFKRQVRHEVEALLAAGRKTAKRLTELIDREYSLVGADVDEACAHHEKWLTDRLRVCRVRVLPMPERPVGEFLMRELKGEKPYKAAAGEGYRDDVLFETLLQEVRDKAGPIAFVTNNTKDFADEEMKRMHPHLAARLRAAGVDPASITMVPTLDALLKTHLTRTLQRDEAYLEKARSETWRDSLREGVSTFASVLGEGAVVPLPVALPASEYRALAEIEQVIDVRALEAWSLPDHGVLVEVEADVVLRVTAERCTSIASERGIVEALGLLSTLIPHEQDAVLHAALIVRDNVFVSASRLNLQTKGAGARIRLIPRKGST